MRKRRTLPRTKTTSRTKFTLKIKGKATNRNILMRTIKEKTSPTRILGSFHGRVEREEEDDPASVVTWFWSYEGQRSRQIDKTLDCFREVGEEGFLFAGGPEEGSQPVC